MFPRTLAEPWHRWTWLIAGLALLGAGALGVAHRATHGGVAAGVSPHVHAAAPAHGHGPCGPTAAAPCTTADGTAGPAAEGLFAEHADGSDQCRLLDQLLQCDSLLAGVWQATPAAPAVLPAVRRASLRAATAPHEHLARGPPAG